MKKDKKFLIPEAILVEFNNEDIIVTSAGDGDIDNFTEGQIPD